VVENIAESRTRAIAGLTALRVDIAAGYPRRENPLRSSAMPLTLITGGSRSGKSTHAITLAVADASVSRRYFIATAEALDDEMHARIAHHQATRPPEFVTIEAPLDVENAIAMLASRADAAVLDCLTLWVSNLMGQGLDDNAILARADALAGAVRRAPYQMIVVTDEVGWGIVPDSPVARRFRDLLGWTNQKVAQVADEVLLMAAGYPLRLK
jgi:adenosylcobinamide kinase / adenosylcobinamide-phosphate guanylyltransferase